MTRLQTKLAGMPLAWQGIILALATLPIWGIFALFGQSSRGEIVWALSGVMTLTATARWELHQHRWFWLVMGAFLLAHLPLIWWNPLHDRRVIGALLTPFVFADYVLAYLVVTVSKRYFDSA